MGNIELEALSAWIYQGGTGQGWWWGKGEEGGGEDGIRVGVKFAIGIGGGVST